MAGQRIRMAKRKVFRTIRFRKQAWPMFSPHRTIYQRAWTIFLAVAGMTVTAGPGWNFSNADWQGWTSANFRQIALRKGNGIVGITKARPYLYSPVLKLDAASCPRLELRLKTTSPDCRLYFSRPEAPFSASRCFHFSPTPEQQRGTENIVIDCTRNSEWKGTISQLRLDLSTQPETMIGFQAIRFFSPSRNLLVNGDFSTLQAPSESLPTGWSGAGRLVTNGQGVQLSPLGTMISAPVELPNGNPLVFTIQAVGKLIVKFVYCDIYGKKLAMVEPLTVEDAGRHLLHPPAEAATLSVELTNSNARQNVRINAVQILPEPEPSLWQAQWIWAPDTPPPSQVFFRREFQVATLHTLREARLQATGDDEVILSLNGHPLTGENRRNWRIPDIFDVKAWLHPGKNVLTASVSNASGPGGLLAELTLWFADGRKQIIGSDRQWKCQVGAAPPASWERPDSSVRLTAVARELGPEGCAPWGEIPFVPIAMMSAAVDHLRLPVAANENSVLNLLPVLCRGKLYVPGCISETMRFSLWLTNGTLKLPIMENIPVDGKQLAAGQPLSLPAAQRDLRYLPDGTWSLTMRLTGADLTASTAGDVTMVMKRTHPIQLSAAKVVTRNGVPQFLFSDAHPRPIDHVLVEMNRSLSEKAEIRNSMEHGITGIWGHFSQWRYADNGKNFDFRQLDQWCTEVLLQAPEAYFVFCVGLSGNLCPAMREWEQKNPAELARGYDGSTEIKNYGDSRQNAPSFASEKWLQEGDRMLSALIDHLQKQPYGARVIGLVPSSGITWEWMYWGAQQKEFVDYSQPFQNAFRTWLRRKYADNIKTLSQAWNKKLASFAEAAVPTPEERAATGILDLRDPSRQAVLDFQTFLSQITGEAICHFAHTIKQRSNGRLLTGAYYGYTNFVLNGEWIPRIGHFDLQQLLDCPDFDMLMAPTRYCDRELGGAGGFMIPEASARLHGKLYINESDIRTLHADDPGHGKVSTLHDSRAVLEREATANLISGVSSRWYDFSSGWIGGDSRLAMVLGKLLKIEQEVAAARPENAATEHHSLAVFTDEGSLNETVMGSELSRMLIADQYPWLHRTGLGADMYLLSDLEKVAGSYRFLIFLNPLRLTAAQCAAIERLKNNGRTLLFYYGVGIIDGKNISRRILTRLLEMPIAMVQDRKRWNLTLSPAGRQYFGPSAPKELESSAAYGPLFYPERGGQVLGTLQNGKPGLVLLQHRDYRIVFSAVPALPGEWLAALAAQTGLLVYNSNHRDITWARGNLFAVHSRDGGKRTLRVPFHNGNVIELLSRRTYVVINGCFTCQLAPASTVIFWGHPE